METQMNIDSLTSNDPVFLPFKREGSVEMRQLTRGSEPRFEVLERGLPRADSNLLARQESFSSVMARSSLSEQNKEPETVAREAAEQMVSINFVQPLLKSLRESSSAAEPFAPSDGEKQFMTLMDAQTAQNIVRAADFPLVERLASDMLNKAGKLRETKLAMTSAVPGRGAASSHAILGGSND